MIEEAKYILWKDFGEENEREFQPNPEMMITQFQNKRKHQKETEREEIILINENDIMARYLKHMREKKKEKKLKKPDIY